MLIVIVFILSCIPFCYEHAEKRKAEINPDKIYLNLSDWNISLKDKAQKVFRPDIVANSPITLRFSLTQDNSNPPQITVIAIDFPVNAVVDPDKSYRNWQWERTNSRGKNEYSINYPSQPPTQGSNKDLPAFSVTFKETAPLPFEYRIEGAKLDKPIERRFIIYPTKQLTQQQPENSDSRNSATPPVVEGYWDANKKSVTPNTVSPDTGVISTTPTHSLPPYTSIIDSDKESNK